MSDLDEDQLLADSSEDEASSPEDSGDGGPPSGGQRNSAADFFGRKDKGGGGGDSSSDSDSDGDDDEVEDMEVGGVDEEALRAELTKVNDKLAAEPYSYDLYLEKIRILKGLEDSDQLRMAREKMSALYPLSPSLWVEWLQDEQKMMSVSTEDEKKYVFSLMEKAVKDYASVEVWLEYVSLCLTNMGEENGVQRCRDVFERALGSCGLIVPTGSLIWDAYRDFEAALLGTMKSDEELLEQEKKYIALCKRQLSVPLWSMKSTYTQVKEKMNIDENTENGYKKALKKLEEVQYWEAKLVQAPDDFHKLATYTSYIASEVKGKSNPARVQCLYERAISESPLSLPLWTEYIDYLSTNLKVPELIFSVCERASRNCPWLVAVWVKYLWAVETFASDDLVFEKMKAVFESALIYCGTGEQAGTLWLKYLEFLRRRVGNKEVEEKRVEILRKSFDAAEAHLLQLVEEPNDFLCQILQFRARFETLLSKGLTEETRPLWRNIFQRGYNTSFRLWNHYLHLEMKYAVGNDGKDAKRIRTEMGKAMGQVTDDPQAMADLWLNFERDYGDLLTLSAAEKKIGEALEKATYNNSSYSHNNYQNSSQSQEFQASARKRKWDNPRGRDRDQMAQGPPLKLKKNERNDTDGFKVPAIPPRKPGGDERQRTATKKTETPVPEPVKHDPSKDPFTIFASNLDYNVNEEGLKDFFAKCGVVEEVRLVKDFQQRSKGFAYIVFKEQDSVGKALETNRQPLSGRPVYVSRCEPDKSSRQPVFKYPTSLEKNKLFVKGLPFSLTEDDVKKLFEPFGPLKACRLVIRRNGLSKGLAFIEFEKSSDASTAIMKIDGVEIEGKTLIVAISNPPKPGSGKTEDFTSKIKPAEPFLRRERNVFVPRAVQVPTKKVEEGPATGNSSSVTTKAKSNADFRKLFMKSKE